MFMKVQVSSIWKKKKYMKESRIRTHDLDDPVYWLRSFTDLKSVRSLKKKKMDITAAIPPDTSILWPTVISKSWNNARPFLQK